MEPTELLLINQQLSSFKTNHFLHLFLTLFTVGFWSIIWVAVTATNCSKRNNILKAANMQTETNYAKILLTTCILFLAFIIFIGWIAGVSVGYG